MSHNLTTVAGGAPSVGGDIDLGLADLGASAPVSGDTLLGTDSGGVEFGALPAPVFGGAHFFAASTVAGFSGTPPTYTSQYIDNRTTSLDTLNSNGVNRTNVGGENVSYGNGSSDLHAQLIFTTGTYFLEHHPYPNFSSSAGVSELQWVRGNAGTANVKGNLAYCASDSPGRIFAGVAVTSGTGQRVWPKMISGANRYLGAGTAVRAQSMTAIKVG